MRPRDAWLLAGTGICCFALLLWLAAPGFMARDSGVQLSQARSGQFSDAHPVLMALMWRYIDRIVAGPIGMLSIMAALHVGALTLLATTIRGPVLWRALGLVAICFFPPLFSNLPVVWKDTLMQSSLIGALACFSCFLQRQPNRRSKRSRAVDVAWAGFGFLLCGIGIGARHNAPPAAAFLLALPLLAIPAIKRLTSWKGALVAAVGGTLLAGAIAGGVGTMLSPLTRKDHFWQTLPAFDLAGLSLKTGKVLVDPATGVLTPGMGLKEIQRLYHPYYSNSLYYCVRRQGRRCVPLFRRTHDPVALARLRNNWLRAIISHPIEYLELRGRVTLALLGIRNGTPATYFVDGHPHHAIAKPYPPTARGRRILSWIDNHLSDPWMRPWPYSLLCLLLAPVTLWRYLRGTGSALAVALPWSGLACLLGLVIASGARDYRYTSWTVLCGVLTLVAAWTCPPERRLAQPEPHHPRSTPRPQRGAEHTEAASVASKALGSSCR